MKERALELSKEILAKSGEVAALLLKSGAKWGAVLATGCGRLAAKCAELAAKGLQTRPMQKMRPAMKIIMIAAAAVTVVSGVCYFAGRKKDI